MTAFEQPPTGGPVSFEPPTPRRRSGLLVLAVAGLVVAGGTAVALLADSDDGSAADLAVGDPGDPPGRPSEDDEQGGERRDGPTAGSETAGSESAGSESGGEPGTDSRSDADAEVHGRIVIDDGDGPRVFEFDDLDDLKELDLPHRGGGPLECDGPWLPRGLPRLDELGPLFDEFERQHDRDRGTDRPRDDRGDFGDLGDFGPWFDEFERHLDDGDFGEIGPWFDEFQRHLEDGDFGELFEDLERGDLGRLFDQFDIESPGVPRSGEGEGQDPPAPRRAIDIQELLDELGVDSIEDLDLRTLMELLDRIGPFGRGAGVDS